MQCNTIHNEPKPKQRVFCGIRGGSHVDYRWPCIQPARAQGTQSCRYPAVTQCACVAQAEYGIGMVNVGNDEDKKKKKKKKKIMIMMTMIMMKIRCVNKMRHFQY